MSIGSLSGWVAKLGDHIDAVANNYITDVIVSLTTALTPLVVVVMTIWWMLLGWAIARGEVQEPAKTVFWKAVKASAIIAFAMGTGAYNDLVVNTADGLRDGMANVFVDSNATGAATTTGAVTSTTVWTAIDAMADQNYVLLNEAAKETSWYDFPSAIALLIMDVGFLVLSMACVYIAILAKVFGTFFIAIGPLFILCLLFKPTQRFFDGWLGMVLNTVVLSWIGLFIVSFSINVATVFAAQLVGKWSIDVNPITTGLQYCAVCLVLAMMIYQAPGWAAALTGGSSMQMGAGMVRDASMSYRAMRGNATPQAPNPSGNSIQQQSRLARASGAIGRAGGTAVRQAKYLAAAARGRR